MRINSVSSAVVLHSKNRVEKVCVENTKKTFNIKVVSMSEYLRSSLSFKGRNKEQAIFYGAEVAPYSKAGGVGVVMKDYASLLSPKDEVVVSPYYGAKKDENGVVKPIMEGNNYVLKVGDNKHYLDLVVKKNMTWGKNEYNPIMLFRLRDEAEKIHYFVFDETTAEFEAPYKNPNKDSKSGSDTDYSSGGKYRTNNWNGDPYAKNSKAFVELLPDIILDKENFNPTTVVCSDSQTAYTHEYIAQKLVANDENYDEIKTTHVGHNLGPGYCGETSMQNMFVNLGATPEQIAKIESDMVFQHGILGDDYFKPFVESTLDETGSASATQIALHYASKERANGNGFIKAFSVVSEDYAKSIAENPQAAHNIHKTAKKLYEDKVFNGILNPLEDSKVDPTKELPNTRYNENCVDTDGTIYPAFDVYPVNPSYSEMRKVKNANKLKLLQRFSAKDVTIVSGNSSKFPKINPEAKDVYDGPVIKQELLDLIEKGRGDEVPVFTTWGRLDTQKGFDIAINAFEKFAKTPQGKNAILIVGCELKSGSEESDKIERKLKSMLEDPELQGRIVHIDGWAPAYALASASDAAIFTSRFEPCGLTDIEAMKYYCTPIVVNTQGFKQKNFDPRISTEAEKATSFKTQHEYDLLKSQIQLIIDAFVHKKDDSLEKVKAEFPVFFSKDEQGNEIYNDSLFVKFAEAYTKYINGKKFELSKNYNYESEYPENWDDWDELSKDFSFKYSGFARDLKDGILISEIASAISAFVNVDIETKEKMFENLKKLDTGWKGNANLHPTNESSYELYRKHHLMSDFSKPTEDDLLIKKINMKSIEDNIKNVQNDDLKTRIKNYIPGAFAGVAVVLFERLASLNKNTSNAELLKEIEKLKQKIAEQSDLQTKLFSAERKISKLVKNARRNIFIAVGVSFIGGVTLAIYGLKHFDKNKIINLFTKNIFNKKGTGEETQNNIISMKGIIDMQPSYNSSKIFSEFSKIQNLK